MVVLETQHCKRWSAACVQAKEATERRSWNNISIISIIYRPITYLRVISREQSLWSSLLSRGEGATDEDREKGRVEMNRGRGHAGFAWDKCLWKTQFHHFDQENVDIEA